MKFLLTVMPFPGTLHPFLAVGCALRARGHEVAIYTSRAVKKKIEDAGFGFFPFPAALDEAVWEMIFSADSMGASWTKPHRVGATLSRFFAETIPLQIEGLEPVLHGWRPDGIVCDLALQAPYLILNETSGVPVALLLYALGCFLPGPDRPAIGLGLPPARGPLSWLRQFLGAKAVDFALKRVRASSDAMRRRYGLASLHAPVLSVMRRLPLFLVTSCAELEYPREDLPSNLNYVGHCSWYPEGEPPDWLRDMPQDVPLVHVFEGTLHTTEPFLMRSARNALAGEPVRVAMATGPYRRPADLGLEPLPPNMRAEQWINHSWLMPRTSVLICAGNTGAMLAALRCGVPIIAIPTEWDHAENAQCVVQAGAGIRIPRWRCTPIRLRKTVEEVLRNPSYRENARRIGAALERSGGAERAAELIEHKLVPAAALKG